MSTYLQAQSVTREALTSAGKITIFQDVSLELNKGESLAIQGASGSGKSTLLASLAGLDIPEQGRVLIDGVDLSTLNQDQRADLRARRVGFVFQSFFLMDEMTALQNVTLALEIFAYSNATERATRWLKRMGLEQRLQHYPRQLSGGEQQRVALARAFAIEPQLLFADEPTANLDSETAQQVLEYLFAMQREMRTCMVIATHDDVLAARCDRILRLEAGQSESSNTDKAEGVSHVA